MADRFRPKPESPPTLEVPASLSAAIEGLNATMLQVWRAIEALQLQVSVSPPSVDLTGVARDDTLRGLLTALEHAESGVVEFPDVQDVRVTEPVTLDSETIEAMKGLVTEMRTNTSTGQRVIAAGGAGGSKLPDYTGTWGYTAGTSGTATLTGGKRVLTITAASASGGTVVIDGGDTITIPASGSVVLEPKVQLADPEIVFTGTDAYVIDWLTG